MQIKLWTSRNTLTFWTHPSVVEVTLQVYAALADRIPEAYDKYVGYIPILIQVFALSFVVLVVGYFTESRTYDILLRKEIMNRHQGESKSILSYLSKMRMMIEKLNEQVVAGTQIAIIVTNALPKYQEMLNFVN